MKVVPVTTVVDTAEDFPDYAFFEVSYSTRPGPPPHGGTSQSTTLHFFIPNSVIKASGSRRAGGALYAVPRAVAEKMPGWKDLAADAAKQSPPKHVSIPTGEEAWLQLARSVVKGEVPGATAIRFGGSAQVPESDSRNVIVETYRITRTAGGVAFVAPATGGLDQRGDCGNSDSGAVSVLGSSLPWRWVAAGGMGALALVLGGVWLVWWLARRANA
jgi:hypothetical protein